MSRKNFSKAHGRAVLAGQVWLMPETDGRGAGEVRVMAVAEGYAMCRRRGCIPFVANVTEMADWQLTSGVAP